MTMLLLLEHKMVECLTSFLILALSGSLDLGIVGLENCEMIVG